MGPAAPGRQDGFSPPPQIPSGSLGASVPARAAPAAAAKSLSVMSDSVRPHRRQPTRLCHPWDSPGKNTGVGCYFLLQCMKVKSGSEVSQLCPTLSSSMDCSLAGSSIHGIFQARVLEWGAIAFSEGVHRCMDLSLGFLFCSIDLYFCLCASTILS